MGGLQARFRTAAGLFALLAVSLSLRVAVPWGHVFRPEGTRFQGPDAWYYARLVEHRVANFPKALSHDPYLAHPEGADVPVGPLFDFAVAGAALVLGAGRPSPALVESVCAGAPALLGALILLPAFFLARRLWGEAAGWISALLVAVLPGQFLSRSLLGYTDHHVAESLLALLCISALARALQDSGENVQAARHAMLRRGFEAGIWLGIYLLVWQGGALLVLILALWVAAQDVSDSLRGRAPRALHAALLCFVTALGIVAPFSDGVRVPSRHLAALGGAVAGTAALTGLAWAVRRLGSGRRIEAPLIAALGLGAAVLSGSVFPGLLLDIRLNLARFWPHGGGATVGEMIPLLDNGPAWLSLWREYTTATLGAAAGLAILGTRALREGRGGEVLLALWSLATLVMTLGQWRFSYYLAVNVALLCGLAVASAMDALSEASRIRGRGLVACGLGLALAGPGLRVAAVQAGQDLGPRKGWIEALERFRQATPEPFGDAASYLAAPGAPLPRSAYGVMAWWDYGYWILRIAHRVPIANPTQHGAATAARFFLAQDETAAGAVMEKAGALYVLVGEDLPFRKTGPSTVAAGTMSALAPWIGEPASRYVAAFQVPGTDGSPRSILLYPPEYFRSMCVRLWAFPHGSAGAPEKAWDFSSVDEGGREKITRSFVFNSSREALDFLARQPAGFRIGSPDPEQPCVPLEPLASYAALPGFESGTLRAFEYRPHPATVVSARDPR